MIQTTLVPENTTVLINIPSSYVGKKVHALVYVEEEITEVATRSLKPTEGDKSQFHTLKEKRKSIAISPLVESLTGVIPEVDPTNEDYYAFLTKKYS